MVNKVGSWIWGIQAASLKESRYWKAEVIFFITDTATSLPEKDCGQNHAKQTEHIDPLSQ